MAADVKGALQEVVALASRGRGQLTLGIHNGCTE